MPRSISDLLFQAQRVLSVSTQGEMGTLLGWSERTGQRWARNESSPGKKEIEKLAALVYPKNAPLAAEIAAAVGTTVDALGLVPPPPPPLPVVPLKLRPDPEHIVDTVVCAAAEAMGVMPEAIRPALLAAFRSARLANLTGEEVEAAIDRKLQAAAPSRAP